jgi:hypothetical protein
LNFEFFKILTKLIFYFNINLGGSIQIKKENVLTSMVSAAVVYPALRKEAQEIAASIPQNSIMRTQGFCMLLSFLGTLLTEIAPDKKEARQIRSFFNYLSVELRKE